VFDPRGISLMAGPVVDTVLRNAKVVRPDGVFTGGVAISGGKIVSISDDQFLPAAREVIDVGGKHLFPGLVDHHVHIGGLRSFSEDMVSETKAAALGGVTTVGVNGGKSMRMSRKFVARATPEDLVSFKLVLPEAIDISNTESMVDISLSLAIMTDQQASEIPEYAEEFGIYAYKFYVGLQSSVTPFMEITKPAWGMPAKWDDGTDFIGFENIAKIGGLAMIHAENFQIVRVLEGRIKATGRKDLVAWAQRSPGWVEAIDVAKYAHLARVTGTTLFVVHTSSKEGLDEVYAARTKGNEIIVETTPHHLIIDPEQKFPGPRARINPPIKETTSRDALWQGIAHGGLQCVGSDHIPGQQSERIVDEDVWAGEQGFVSTQAILPLMVTEGHHKRGIPLERIAEVCSTNPAKAFGLFPRKGVIEVGSDADLVIADIDKKRSVDERDPSWSDSSNFSVYQSRELSGWPTLTMVRGQVVMKDGKLTGGPRGQYIRQHAITPHVR
jgi:dihydroorotase-like cyclic amidohydrolase